MAVDTRQRRSSAIRFARPWMINLPPSSGGIDAFDRRQLGFSYSGFVTITELIEIVALESFAMGAAAGEAFVIGDAAVDSFSISAAKAESFPLGAAAQDGGCHE